MTKTNNVVEKIWSFLGLEVTGPVVGEEEAINELYDELEEKETVQHEFERTIPQAAPTETISHVGLSMMLVKPKTHVDAQIIIDSLKAKQPIIVNLEKNDVAEAQRVIDFVSGAVYALGGEVKVISKKIFAIIPDNVGFADA